MHRDSIHRYLQFSNRTSSEEPQKAKTSFETVVFFHILQQTIMKARACNVLFWYAHFHILHLWRNIVFKNANILPHIFIFIVSTYV